MNRFKPVVGMSKMHRAVLTLLIATGTILLMSREIPVLANNLLLVRLLPEVVSQPLRPEEVLGWKDRPSFAPSCNKSGLAMVLDRIESPRTRASMLALIGQWSSAERILQTISAGDALARFWLAFVYGQQHQSDEALKTLRSVPSIEVYFAEAGFEAERQGNYERAMQLWEASTLFDGGDLRQRAHVNQTLSRTAYNHFGDWEAALRWAERWIDAASGDTDSYIWLASLHLWGGSPEAAYQVLERGALHGVQNSRFYPGQMGQIYQARGQWDLAIQFYRQSWEQNQDDPGMSPYIAWYLGFALAHELHFQEARPYLEIVKRTGKPELRQQATDLLTWINTQEPQ